jgi:cytoskeletal protein RodZ
MGSVASDLKSEREKRKISLAQIAADTRISLRHLESLEEGRYADLPGGMYNRAFLKAYCESIHIDQREIMRRYEAEILPFSDNPPKSRVHIPPQNSSLRFSPLIVWSLMLLISATGLFFSRKWIRTVFSPYFPHPPVASARLEPEPRPPAASPRPEPELRSPDAPSAPQPSAPIVSPAEPSVPSSPSASQETAVPATALLRLEIVVTAKCWISIDRDGRPAVRKLLEPGEVQSLDAAEKFFLVIGNAGGVHLKINGKPAKPIGNPGEVVKLLIDEKNLPDLIDQTAG